MASSTKKNKKAKSKFRRYMRPAIIALMVIIVAALGWNTHQHNQEQQRLEASLNQKGQELDALAENLRDLGIVGDVERSQFCYEASRKFAKGPTYCMQKAEMVADGVADKQIVADFAIIADVMASQTSLDMTNRDILSKFDEDNRIYSRFYQDSRSEYANCYASFYGKSNRWHNETRGSYKIRVDCLGADFSRSIYEFQE